MIRANTRTYLESQSKVSFFNGRANFIKNLINEYINKDEYINGRITSGIVDGILAIDFCHTGLVVRTSERLVFKEGKFFWEVSFYSQPATEKIKVFTIYINVSSQFYTDSEGTLIDIYEELDPNIFLEGILSSAMTNGLISI